MNETIYKYYIVTETGAICGCTVHYEDAVTELINQYEDFQCMKGFDGDYVGVAIETLDGRKIREVFPFYQSKQKAYDELMSAERRARA